MIRVAINGYGRIGRVAHRIILEKFQEQIEVVAINAGSSTDITGWMYLFKYDSAYRTLENHELSVVVQESQNETGLLGKIVVDKKEIPVFAIKDPALLPWGTIGVDVVIEATGHFRKKEQLELHIKAGAKAVVLSAPSKDDKTTGSTVSTYVQSVNADMYKGETIVTNASCTTNCIAPVAKIISDHFGIEKAMMTTVHGYTSDQRLLDGGHKDYRRARAAAHNIIPTSTGATQAAAKAVPSLQGIFGGLAIRVPVITGSLADFTFLLRRSTTIEEINTLFEKSVMDPHYRGRLAVTREPIVSSDIIGSSYSSIVDLSLTQVVGGNMVKIIAWYDNEYGYANRLIEEVVMVAHSVQ